MNASIGSLGRWVCLGGMMGVLMVGCRTPGLNWDERIGVYSVEQVTAEMGNPYNSWALEDGTKVLEYVTESTVPWSGGYAGRISNPTQRPESELRAGGGQTSLLTLTFAPSGRLLYWTREGAKE